MSNKKPVAHHLLIVREKNGTVHGTYNMRCSHRNGVPYLALSPILTSLPDIYIYLGDVAEIYAAWTGTEDTKWRALSQVVLEGILPPIEELKDVPY